MKKILILVVLFLTGCDNNKTVEYWSEHTDERADYLKKCSNGDVDRSSQNCENARISQSLEPTSESFKYFENAFKNKDKNDNSSD